MTRLLSSLTCLALAVSAAGGRGVAQSRSSSGGSAWFGVARPAGMGDVHRPIGSVAGATMPAAQVPAGESARPDLLGSRIHKDVVAIVNFSKQSRAGGDRVWGRVNGFPALAATMTWTAEQFNAAGLTGVTVQEYDASAPMWWAKSWDVRLLGDEAFGEGTSDLLVESALPTGGSQITGTLTAPLVLVGNTTEAVPPAVNVKGKVAVQHLTPAAGAFSERGRTTERARELAKRGAVAVFNVVEQAGNMHVRDFANCGVPCFNIGGADGAFIEAVVERAGASHREIRAQMRLDSGMLTGLKGQNAIGVVPGRGGAAAENIIVNAHADGWFDAAGDNADGLAVLVAMARHFARPENRLERNLVFVGSGGHHSTGLNGPSNFVRMNPAVTAKTVLVLNLEHVAQFAVGANPWRVESREQPMSFGISNQSPLLIDIGTRGAKRYGFNLNATFGSGVPGDLGGYAPLGVARVQAIHSGPMYHTSGDVAETISAPGLERAARFFVFFVTEAASAARASINPPQP